MPFLYVAIILLMGLFWLGVGFIVFEIIRQLLDKRDLEKKFEALRKSSDDFFQDTFKKIDQKEDQYSETILSLQKETVRLKSQIQDVNQRMKSVLEYANRLSELNDEFFNKIEIIDRAVSEENIQPESLKLLVAEIKNDTLALNEWKKEQERFSAERKKRIEDRYREEQHRGPDLER